MVYLDNAATTAIRPEVFEAMKPYLDLTASYGNPSSHHEFGRKARKAVETARTQVAYSIGAKPQEIVFTSGGSEADNLAIKGWCDCIFLNSTKREVISLMCSEIEHKAVLESCKYMFHTRRDVDFIKLYVDSQGILKEDCLVNALEYNKKYGYKSFVSVMFANNEIGTIQDIKHITEVCHEYGAIVHTDATQYYGHGEIRVEKLGVDMLTASGHKIGAAKGTGFLYVKSGINLSSLIHGGKQEHGLRAGTENVAGIVGLGQAASMIDDMILDEKITRSNMKFFYDYYIDLQRKEFGSRAQEYNHINGVDPFKQIDGVYRRLGNNLSLCLKDVEAESLLEMLSDYGVYASAGSACNAGNPEPSYVLKAIGLTNEETSNTLRFSFTADMREEDLKEAVELLNACVSMLRK